MKPKTYIGIGAEARDWRVLVEEPGRRRRALPLRLGLFNHSPTGFAWGYGGSGPAQLALAILADALGDDDRAVRLHQPFKRRVIARLDQHSDWQLELEQVLAVVADLEAENDPFSGLDT